MRRGANGEMRSASDALETINAAATAIASAENRASQASVQVQKRRWASCFSIYWCFGSQKQQNKRIVHAVFDPETAAPREDRLHSVDNPTRTSTSIMLPFVAPPSSPASFLQSEPPSATQSPAGVISFSSMSANIYSPGGPNSIFAIGPYAHETQLVSPPVFSTFTTEPSTAPFTPPPESVHLTTPSSPEVPFAKLLDPNLQNVGARNMFPLSPHEFQSYQLQPGSPISRLLSPGSAISGSGTSSPFPDREFGVGDPYFLEFRTGDPPKLLNLEKIAPHEWGSRQRSGTLTPDRMGTRSHDNFNINHQSSDVTPLSSSYNRWKNDDTVLNHRVSFEVTAEDFLRCMEKKPGLLSKAGFAPLEKGKSTAKGEGCTPETKIGHDCFAVESSGESFERASANGEDRKQHHPNQSITLGSSEEFNFDNINDELSDKPSVAGSDWWANEKDLGQGSSPCQKWSFFPMIQPGIS
ncbi:uncharacterized protein LOC116000288 [Ipomoea triloba]|uniref:uncharacterized protein LOC116000288 n=1 Tax=Ipomoea triloba TaxID=35885 RepID=UPI00125DA911|nr:uncharacterized protein LOC116000288 [Ipomoea triloba]